MADGIGKHEDLSNPSTFSYVPQTLNEKGLPKMGRANYEGQSIFYASKHIKTNFKEISKECNVGDEAYMAKWVLKPNSNLHLYRAIPNWGISRANAKGIFTITVPEIVNSELGIYLKRLGYIMMSNEEIGKYLGSSYIANCIYKVKAVFKDSNGNIYEDNVHYDGIAYPSAIGNANEVNIALKPEIVDNNMELECVFKGRLAPDLRSMVYDKIGFNENGRIIWYKHTITAEKSYVIKDVQYFDSNGNYVDVSKGHILDVNDNVVTSKVSPLIQVIDCPREEIIQGLSDLVQTSIKDVNQAVAKSSLEKVASFAIFKKTDGWKLVEEHKITPLKSAVFSITLKNQLTEISPNKVR